MTTLYLVSIEPMFSQGVGDYQYLCDSIEKVEHFRDLFRTWAGTIKQTFAVENCGGMDIDSAEERSSGFEFFERIYVVTSLNHTAQKISTTYSLRTSSCRSIHNTHYCDFWWLNEPKAIVNYTQNVENIQAEEMTDLPSLDRINDNVQCLENITIAQFMAENEIQSVSVNAV
jgi:hypothetical protein